MISYIKNFYRDLSATIELSSFRDFKTSCAMFYIFRKVRRHTQVRIPRLKALYRLTKELDVRHIPGDFVECGVYKGGSAGLMAYISGGSPQHRSLWLFDSFEGEPPPTEEDGTKMKQLYYRGWCKADKSTVERLFSALSISPARFRIIPGWFQDTFPVTETPSRVALIHFDCDMYDSNKLCLEKFYDALQPGGYLVFNSYEVRPGSKRAMEEFMQKRNLSLSSVSVDGIGRYFQKQ